MIPSFEFRNATISCKRCKIKVDEKDYKKSNVKKYMGRMVDLPL